MQIMFLSKEGKGDFLKSSEQKRETYFGPPDTGSTEASHWWAMPPDGGQCTRPRAEGEGPLSLTGCVHF